MSLYEKYRPSQWSEVVGQNTAVDRLRAIAARGGFGGKAFWLSGSSGTGKTTIARIMAREVADDYAVDELDAADLTADYLRDCERRFRGRPIGGKGWAVIVNEAHGLRADQVRKLLVTLEAIAPFVVWIFTTTSAGQDKLFADMDDAGPLLSRCIEIRLAQRDLCEAFAQRLYAIAAQEGLGGKPIEAFRRIFKDKRNNFRAGFQSLEAGELLAEGSN